MNRGEVHWVNLDPAQGSEIRKRRPCVLVGATPINRARRAVVVVSLSTSAKPRRPLTVPVQCLGRQVVAVCDQIRAVDKSRVLEAAGSLSKEDLEAIEEGLRQVLVL